MYKLSLSSITKSSNEVPFVRNELGMSTFVKFPLSKLIRTNLGELPFSKVMYSLLLE